MKIAIICGTHYGARNDSPIFLDYFLTFFEGQFFPLLREYGITSVLQLGDLIDRRKFFKYFYKFAHNQMLQWVTRGFPEGHFDEVRNVHWAFGHSWPVSS